MSFIAQNVANEIKVEISSMYNRTEKLRLILGDQLNAAHPWFKEVDKNCTYIVAELHQEATYAKHHIQKIQAFFSAMANFAQALSSSGHHVIYLTLDDTAQFEDLTDLLQSYIGNHTTQFEYQQPDEYRLSVQLKEFCVGLSKSKIKTECVDSYHFLLPHEELTKHFKANTSHRMEFFYRYMRKRFNILVDENDQPANGQWNFDQKNRQKLKKQDLSSIPLPLIFSNNVKEINERIERHNIKTIGKSSNELLWPINRQQSNELLHYFCKNLLSKFGTFQDAMTHKADDAITRKQWSLYHARLSFSLNSKMLSPQHVVNTVLDHYQKNADVSIEQVEGFIRQIIGWREFIRGMYWANMPHYTTKNHLNAKNNLPDWFWTADTKMNCLHHAISQSLEFGYAHHIQRLMITGNFCLIAGIAPQQVDTWYLGIYVDAIEWVELPNTRGMSQFADGGLIASKAYAASGNYVNKMSDYCPQCFYSVKEKSTENACPLNSLYWYFMNKHQPLFSSNPRQAMVYRNWQKLNLEAQSEILNRAQHYLNNIDNL